MLSRPDRVLGHLKMDSWVFSERTPTAKDIREGEHREVMVDGILRVYTKRRGVVRYITYTDV